MGVSSNPDFPFNFLTPMSPFSFLPRSPLQPISKSCPPPFLLRARAVYHHTTTTHTTMLHVKYIGLMGEERDEESEEEEER